MAYSVVWCLLPASVLLLVGIRKLRHNLWGYCKNNVSLINKVVIVTGANSGIGYEVAKELASRKATVVLACRDVAAGEEAIARIEKQLGRKLEMSVMELDLASLKSIQKFASNVQALYPRIHILVNNAGVSYPKNELHLTQDNLDVHFGINYLGHFYLTQLLLDTLKESTPSRIVVVSSSLHERAKIDFGIFLNSSQERNNLYANSKLANVYFAKELAKRVKGSTVCVYAVCPGWVYTRLFRHSVRWYHYILAAPVAFFFMRSPKQGSQTVVYCATEPNLETQTGLLYKDCKSYSSRMNFDDNTSSKLWDATEKLISERTN